MANPTRYTTTTAAPTTPDGLFVSGNKKLLLFVLTFGAAKAAPFLYAYKKSSEYMRELEIKWFKI